jgi:multidrug transporter EmrE-like cation transporter
MNTYIAIGLAIIFNVIANIILKFGVGKEGAEGFNLFKVVLNPVFIAGAFSFGVSLLCYWHVLSKINLSIAYPIITSSCFILIVLFSWLFLKEKLLLIQVAGFFLIVTGIWLVAKGIH